MPRQNDFAILVGVEHYPHTGFKDLEGPTNDVQLFRGWLTDLDGGDVPDANIKEFISPDPRPVPEPADFPPTHHEILNHLRTIVLDINGNIVRRPGRLYLYFSGHGFANFSERINHAALYTANARRRESNNVCGTKVADWCVRAAAFDEVVLVMDCCRNEEISKNAYEVPFDDLHDPRRSRNVRRLEIYAVPYNDEAQERHFNDLKATHGVLTYALVRALYCAPLGKGARNSQAIKQFIEGGWGSLVGSQRIEAPEFVLPTRGDIVFSTSPPKRLPRRILFSKPLTTLGELRIIGTDGGNVARFDLDAARGQQTPYDMLTGTAGVPEPFDGKSIDVNLPVELYEIVLKRPAHPDAVGHLSMMGDDDAVLEL